MRPRADTLLVWTGAACINGCATCPIDPGAAPAGVSPADLQRALAAVPDVAGRLAVLVGGEPLLRPDLVRLVAAVRAAGAAPGLITTGRPLLYPQLRERLRRAGIAYLRVQLFGTGATHDRATAVGGSYQQALDGLRAWLAEAGGAAVDVALYVRGRSADALAEEIEALAAAVASPAVQLIVSADAAATIDLLCDEGLHRRLAALAGWNDDAGRPLLAWETATALRGPLLAPPPAAFAGAAPPASCLGATAALSGGRRVLQLVQANSFNFVRTGPTVPWTETAEACTAHAAGAGTEPLRQLWLVEGDRLALHATDTGDFAAPDIAHIKDEHSHLFVDRAAAGVLDDFTEGMRRVRPDPLCAGCAHRAACGHRFAVVEGPPFAREEAWIAAHVAALRGRVLDVGCGEQLYRDVLAPLVGSGAVRYTGLDPDQPSLDALRAVLPAARLLLGGIEQFRGTPASYDHVLCLRSLNHVADLDEAMARMAELLVPGGRLLIVETTPFAMLRTPEQVAAADRAPRAGHQHFRNVASQAVLPFARRHGLRVAHHHPASLANTNEWILLLERPAAPSDGAGVPSRRSGA